MKDFEAQTLMLKLASDYDKLADRVEDRAASDESGLSQQNAAECRQRAAEMTDPQLRKQLENMADVWDTLARQRRQGIVEGKPNQAQTEIEK
jgi:hypothetical protein